MRRLASSTGAKGALQCGRRESNPYELPPQFLRLMRIPFRHSRACIFKCNLKRALWQCWKKLITEQNAQGDLLVQLSFLD